MSASTFLNANTSFVWLAVGMLGQLMFSLRFIVQWLASEKAKQSIVPHAFWYFSIGGGCVLLAYAVHLRDPVFIFGQAMGLMVYLRNLYFIRSMRDSKSVAASGARQTAVDQ